MLKGNNIILRVLQESDLDFLERIENNVDNWQFGGERKQYTQHELLEYISNSTVDIKIAKQLRFAIALDDSIIGFVDLFDYTPNKAGVGIIIIKEHRRKGYAKEALQLLCVYAAKTLNIDKLECSIKKDNLASIRLFSSCGFNFLQEKEEIKYFVKLAKN